MSKKEYTYPSYMPETYRIKGVTISEGIVMALVVVIPMILSPITGTIIGIVFAITLYALLNRLADGRNNLAGYFYHSIRYIIMKNRYPAFTMRGRKELEDEETAQKQQ